MEELSLSLVDIVYLIFYKALKTFEKVALWITISGKHKVTDIAFTSDH